MDTGLIVEHPAFLRNFLQEDVVMPIGFIPGQVIQEVAKQPEPAEQNVKATTSYVEAATPAEPLPQPAVPQPTSLPLPYKGGNAKQFLIFVREPGHEYLSADDEALLMKILQALQLSLEDVALTNLSKWPKTSWQAIMQQFNPQRILTFGMPTQGYPQLALSQRYTIVNMNAYKLLHADALSALQQSVDLKRQLWNQLKSF